MTDTTGASMEKDFSNTPPADSRNGSGNGMMNGEGTPLLGKDLDHETAMRQIQRENRSHSRVVLSHASSSWTGTSE